MSEQWIQRSVLYQINLRALAVREPRNAFEAMVEKRLTESPLAYVTRNLPRLKRLGVNLLYLMPPFPMGQESRKGIGSPYSIRDFYAVDPEHGTLDDLAALVRRAHALGFRLIMDLTPNHTARDHVWTREHPEFYFHDGATGLRYDWDWSDTAKLNYGDSGLRQAMREMLDHWLGFLGRDASGRSDGVDGFRFDMAHIISDTSFWNETLPTLQAKHAPRQILFMAESYGTRNNLDLFQRGMNAAYDDDLYKVCQFLFARDSKGDTVLAVSDDARRSADYAPLVAAFDASGPAGMVEHALAFYERALPAAPSGPWLARYTDNHDEGRGVYRFGAGGVRAMMQVVFLSGHTIPFLLTGQEFGALNRPPIHERINLCDKGYRLLTAEGVRTRDGVETEGNVFARSMAERQEWLAFYRTLAALRRGSPALTEGSFSLLDVGEAGAQESRTVVAFARRKGRVVLHCAINLGPEPRTLRRADLFAGRVVYGGLSGDVLPPFAAVAARVPVPLRA